MSVTSLAKVRLPIPSFWRQSDLEKIAKALNNRSVVLGETNPTFPVKEPGSFYEIKKPTHRLENFRATDGQLTASVKIIDPEVLGDIIDGRSYNFSIRRNNDVFAKDGSTCSSAPGLIAIDIRFN